MVSLDYPQAILFRILFRTVFMILFKTVFRILFKTALILCFSWDHGYLAGAYLPISSDESFGKTPNI